MLYGSVNPQHLGCALAAALPIEYVFPVLQMVIEILVVVGAYAFALHVLRTPPREAVYAGMLYLVVYYGHNENPYVTQVGFVPLLAFLTSVEASGVSRVLRACGVILVTVLSFPFYAVPIMPVAHVAVLMLSSRRRENAVRAAMFWVGFAIFYAPNFAKYMTLAARSNRSFFHFGAASGGALDLVPIMVLKAVAFPTLASLAVASRAARRPVILALTFAVVAGIVTALQQSSLWNSAPDWWILVMTLTSRLFYFIPIPMFLALTAGLLARAPAYAVPRRLGAAAAVAGGLGLAVAALWSPLVGVVTVVVGTWVGALVLLDPVGRVRRPVALAAVMVAFILPASLARTITAEALPYGNLFAVEDAIPDEPRPNRVVTVVAECYPHRVYAAQAAVRGRETLDGVTVYYDRGFAERWWWFVTRGSRGCSEAFYYWNNRIELTAHDLQRRPDLVLAWLRLNNVVWVRSEVPLEFPGLVLTSSTATPRYLTRATLCRVLRAVGAGAVCQAPPVGGACARCGRPETEGCAACYFTTYVYRLDGAFPRVFLVDAMVAPPTLADEETLVRAVVARGPHGVPIIRYGASRVAFQGAFAPETLVAIGSNAVEGWHVAVDGVRCRDCLTSLFGMVAIRPIAGPHRYDVWFDDGVLPGIGVGAVAGALVMGLALPRRRRKKA